MSATTIDVNEVIFDLAGIAIREAPLSWRGKFAAMGIVAWLGDAETIPLDKIAMPPDDDGSAGLRELLDWIERKRDERAPALTPVLREKLEAIATYDEEGGLNTAQIIAPQDAAAILAAIEAAR